MRSKGAPAERTEGEAGLTGAQRGVYPREVVITHLFDAPRGVVFEMWTDPEKVSKWWGPDGSVCLACEVEARPGGHIRIDVRGHDGVVYPMTGVFEEVIEPERLVFRTESPNADGDPYWRARNTATFEEDGRKTKLTLVVEVVMAAPSAQGIAEQFRLGWRQSMRRLEKGVA